MTLARRLAEVAHETGRARFSRGAPPAPVIRPAGLLQPPRCHAGAGHAVSCGRHAVLGDLCYPCLLRTEAAIRKILRQSSRSD